VKLVHLFGFITKKFVTMQHGHMKVKIKNEIGMPLTTDTHIEAQIFTRTPGQEPPA
jgi:hypothetical protein